MSVEVAGGPGVDRLSVIACTVPTEVPESDGTAEWDSTTVVIVEAEAGGQTGIGWTYGPRAVATLVEDMLAPAVESLSAFETGRANLTMRQTLRNAGATGPGAHAISAVDVALFDLKAKLLDLPLAALLGQVHDEVPIYGSGGFCSYTPEQLTDQLGGWAAGGIPRVKMKVGRAPAEDLERVRTARAAIGERTELYVDANGALTVAQSLAFASAYSELGVSWFEEPVSSLNLDGLSRVRAGAPPGMDIAAGEYGYRLSDFHALAPHVDCLQADVTRCGGITGLLDAAAVAEAHELDLSGHTAPSIHAHALCAVTKLRHLEWFHDHVRIERLLFDGFLEPEGGVVCPDLSRPGLGVELKRDVAERFAA